MIELTTGVVFLMTSLYGSGNAGNHVDNIADDSNTRAVIAVEAENASLAAGSDSKIDSTSAEAYVRKAFADTPILVDIARCESNFNQFKNGKLVRGIVNSQDVGVMQINEKYHSATAKKLGIDLHSLEGNVAYAKHLYEEQGSQPWVHSSKCWAATDIAKI